ncbi:hypothetical protein OGAPHI_004671 [Ogataea philodendri]|uniref:Xylanolytic transcriptional activator regulatory domain-containing protein n=1 Tax=Ogataea philodendri TaxID=1378263 RepID=A0A9P8P339_9ASCO|nr:uncharacterized protein OGAPHI_004671 [Ogataea philodendri]KAH3663957.1 hypothetical protein OGAPHI_004671 [Ogataea philodendri]
MSPSISKICVSCKGLGKRDCDGTSPSCSNCVQVLQPCCYKVEADRRRRKYQASYIFQLQEKVNKLESHLSLSTQHTLCDELTPPPENPAKYRKKLNKIDQSANESVFAKIFGECLEFKGRHDSASRDLLSKEEFEYGFSDLEVLHVANSFKFGLIELTRDNSFQVPYVLRLSLSEIEEWDFMADFIPSHRLVICSMFGIAALYSDLSNAHKFSKIFINQAANIARQAFMLEPDRFLVQGLLLLSSYEMGMGSDRSSYMYSSMACNILEHMGYHAQSDSSSSKNNEAANLDSALFWSVCLQDRIISTKLGLPACLHYKRVATPFYQVQGSAADGKSYICELSFSYTTRLWYILDRFQDQIFASQHDVGDSQEHVKLHDTAELCFKDIKSLLPPLLKKRNIPEDPSVIYYHMCHFACLILLESTFVKQFPVTGSRKCILAANEISRLIEELFDSGQIYMTSYHFGFICYLAATVHLSLYIVLSQKQRSILVRCKSCFKALEINGLKWKGSLEYLRMLNQFAEANEVTIEEPQNDMRLGWLEIRQPYTGSILDEFDQRVPQTC